MVLNSDAAMLFEELAIYRMMRRESRLDKMHLRAFSEISACVDNSRAALKIRAQLRREFRAHQLHLRCAAHDFVANTPAAVSSARNQLRSSCAVFVSSSLSAA